MKGMEMTSGEEFKVSFKVKNHGLVAVKECGVYFHAVGVYKSDTTTDDTLRDDVGAFQNDRVTNGPVSQDHTIRHDNEVSQLSR